MGGRQSAFSGQLVGRLDLSNDDMTNVEESSRGGRNIIKQQRRRRAKDRVQHWGPNPSETMVYRWASQEPDTQHLERHLYNKLSHDKDWRQQVGTSFRRMLGRWANDGVDAEHVVAFVGRYKHSGQFWPEISEKGKMQQAKAKAKAEEIQRFLVNCIKAVQEKYSELSAHVDDMVANLAKMAVGHPDVQAVLLKYIMWSFYGHDRVILAVLLATPEWVRRDIHYALPHRLLQNAYT
jgi:hypothetical protein